MSSNIEGWRCCKFLLFQVLFAIIKLIIMNVNKEEPNEFKSDCLQTGKAERMI